MCKEHCSPASEPKTQRVIVTMKEGLDEKQKADFIKDLEEKGGKVCDKLDCNNKFIAEAPVAVIKSMEVSAYIARSDGLALTDEVAIDGSVTLEISYL